MDDLTTHPASNKSSFRELDQFNVSPMNDRMAQIWNGCYKYIQGANNIINNYQNTVGDADRIKQIAGEAYFLRALDYFWLTRLWGDIPLIKFEIYSPEILSLTKSTPADIYTLIESDLAQAESFMQDKKTEAGRTSKGGAKALLAEVYLTEGGWPTNNAGKYALAAAKAKKISTIKLYSVLIFQRTWQHFGRTCHLVQIMLRRCLHFMHAANATGSTSDAVLAMPVWHPKKMDGMIISLK